MKPTTIKNLHIDLKGGQAVKNHTFTIETDDEKVSIELSEQDVNNLADFITHHCFTRLEIKGKTSLSLGMVKKTLKLWIPSFIRKKY